MKFRYVLFLLLFSCSTFISAQTSAAHNRHPSDKRNLAPSRTPAILYHGGPVMVPAKDLYVIYYGTFNSAQPAILDTFL